MRLINKETGEEISSKGLFKDNNGKERKVLFMTRIIHERTATILNDIGREEQQRIPFPYMEVVVESKNGKPMPIEWWEEEIFLKNNPHIEVLE
jgi:hypothetical protein